MADVTPGSLNQIPSEVPLEASSPQPAFVRYGLLIAGTIAGLIGAFWLIAWRAGVAALWSATPGVITVKTNMALGQVLAGAALLLLAPPRLRSLRKRLGTTAAAIVFLIGALTLSEHLFHYNAGIDQLLATELPGAAATASPNRMGPPGSLSLLLLGAGLLAITLRRRAAAPYLGIAVCLINLVPAIGYVYGIDEFYQLPHTGIAWPTVVALTSLAIGLVLTHSEGGPMAMLLRQDAGGRLLRRLFPATLLMLLVLGFAKVQGERRGIYDTESGTAVFVIALAVLFSVGLWLSAARLSRSAQEEAEARERLRASEQRWATTLSSIGDAVISTCARGKVVFMNDMAQKLTGWTLEEARDQDLGIVFNIVQEGTRIKPEHPVSKVIRLGQVVGLANHTLLIRRDGAEIPIDDSAAPIRNHEGTIEGVVLVFHDVSEQRKAEKTLRDSDRLATMGRLAATIAHEIHNPLDAVGNLLYLIEKCGKEEPVSEYISLASQEVGRIAQMTQHMLSFQREAVRPVPVRFGEVFENVLAIYQKKIASAGIQVNSHVEEQSEVLAMPGEMRQVIANLVGNAIEALASQNRNHNENRQLWLRAYPCREWRHGQCGLRVVVADNGPGIPAEIREKIFEPFFTTKGESGTGLGLWITSDIISKYGGSVRLRSSTRENASGTCFSLFFAAHKAK
jgi:PAS domain S-box-containing protein